MKSCPGLRALSTLRLGLRERVSRLYSGRMKGLKDRQLDDPMCIEPANGHRPR